VQDKRHSCNGTLGNRMWPIEWHHCQCTFAVWNLSNSSTSWNRAQIH